MGCGGGSGTTKTQRRLEKLQYNTMLEQQALYKQMLPIIMRESGMKQDPATGNWIQMSDEERYAAMDELEKSQYDIAKSTAARQQQALAGTLPLSPALVESLEKQKADLESYYSQRLGPRYKESTPYIQAMGELTKKQGLLTQEYQTGQMTAGEALMLQSLGGYGGVQSSGIGQAQNLAQGNLGSIGAGNQLLSYYAQQQNANAQRQAGLLGGIGGLLGTGLMAYGTYAGLAGLGGKSIGLGGLGGSYSF